MKWYFRSPFFLFLLSLAGCTAPEGDAASAKQARSRKAYQDMLKGKELVDAGRYEAAFPHLFRAKDVFLSTRDTTQTVYALTLLAEIYQQSNDYGEMQATAVEGLRLVDAAKDKTYAPYIWNLIGISHAMQHDYDAAIGAYRKALDYPQPEAEKLTMENNIAYMHLLQENYRKAYDRLLILDQSPHLGKSVSRARILDNLGYAAFRLGKSEGIALMLAAVKLREEQADTLGLITNHLHLAESHWPAAPDRALRFARRADSLAMLNHAAEDRLETLKFLIEHAGRDEVKPYALSYTRINDSLQRKKQTARNSFAQIKYNVDKERRQTVEERLKSTRQKYRALVWLVIALVCMLALLLLTFYFIRRNALIRRKARYEAEQRVSAQLHDGLANDVHKAIMMAETADLSDADAKERLLQRLDGIYKGTRSISRENAGIPQNKDFALLLREIMLEYQSPGCTIITKGIADIPWQKLERDRRNAIYRIVQELLANMRKHSRCTRAVFSFGQERGNLLLRYTDDGIGMPAGSDVGKNGLRIMENRISEMKGTLTFDTTTGKGFRLLIEIPL